MSAHLHPSLIQKPDTFTTFWCVCFYYFSHLCLYCHPATRLVICPSVVYRGSIENIDGQLLAEQRRKMFCLSLEFVNWKKSLKIDYEYTPNMKSSTTSSVQYFFTKIDSDSKPSYITFKIAYCLINFLFKMYAMSHSQSRSIRCRRSPTSSTTSWPTMRSDLCTMLHRQLWSGLASPSLRVLTRWVQINYKSWIPIFISYFEEIILKGMTFMWSRAQ